MTLKPLLKEHYLAALKRQVAWRRTVDGVIRGRSRYPERSAAAAATANGTVVGFENPMRISRDAKTLRDYSDGDSGEEDASVTAVENSAPKVSASRSCGQDLMG